MKQVPLCKVLAEERTKLDGGTVRQMVTLQCPVYSPSISVPTTATPQTAALGTLHVTLVLEDMGPLALKKLLAEDPSQNKAGRKEKGSGHKEKYLPDSVNVIVSAGHTHEATDGQSGGGNVRFSGGVGGDTMLSSDSVEYKVAMELEMWKASEEEAFQVCVPDMNLLCAIIIPVSI